MTSNIYGLIKSAETDDTVGTAFNIGGSILPALLGTLGGGAAGYLTGSDDNELTGEKSTRLRNAIIGALLGGGATGLGYYGLLSRQGDAFNKHNRLERENYEKMKKQFDERPGLSEDDNEQSQMSKQSAAESPEESGVGTGLLISALNAINPDVALPALLGLLGGGATGYVMTDDKKNRFKNTILGALTGTTAGALGGGASSIMYNTSKMNDKNKQWT